MPYDDDMLKETHGTKTIYIVPDPDPLNPRKDYDHAATMVCFHREYDLGDEHDYRDPDEAIVDVCGIELEYDDELYDIAMLRQYKSRSDFLDAAPVIYLNLYLYDHSGITMNTTGFHCPWDSGQVGFIYITEERAKKEWPMKGGEARGAWVKRVKEYLKAEVEEYDAYISGQVYGYRIEEDGEEIDACWGFYGYKDALNAAREASGVET